MATRFNSDVDRGGPYCEIDWDKDKGMMFLGRNGRFSCCGLWVADRDDRIGFAPITSKDDVGRCDIEIPIDALPLLIEHLQILLEKGRGDAG